MILEFEHGKKATVDSKGQGAGVRLIVSAGQGAAERSVELILSAVEARTLATAILESSKAK